MKSKTIKKLDVKQLSVSQRKYLVNRAIEDAVRQLSDARRAAHATMKEASYERNIARQNYHRDEVAKLSRRKLGEMLVQYYEWRAGTLGRSLDAVLTDYVDGGFLSKYLDTDKVVGKPINVVGSCVSKDDVVPALRPLIDEIMLGDLSGEFNTSERVAELLAPLMPKPF